MSDKTKTKTKKTKPEMKVIVKPAPPVPEIVETVPLVPEVVEDEHYSEERSEEEQSDEEQSEEVHRIDRFSRKIAIIKDDADMILKDMNFPNVNRLPSAITQVMLMTVISNEIYGPSKVEYRLRLFFKEPEIEKNLMESLILLNDEVQSLIDHALFDPIKQDRYTKEKCVDCRIALKKRKTLPEETKFVHNGEEIDPKNLKDVKFYAQARLVAESVTHWNKEGIENYALRIFATKIKIQSIQPKIEYDHGDYATF